MADHAKPVLTSTYSSFITELDTRFDDLAVGLDPATNIANGWDAAINFPSGSIRWNSATNRWQKWSGTLWGDLSSSFEINVNGTVGASAPASGAFTTVTASGNVTLSNNLAGGIPYLDGSKVLVTSDFLRWNGAAIETSGLQVSGQANFKGPYTAVGATSGTSTSTDFRLIRRNDSGFNQILRFRGESVDAFAYGSGLVIESLVLTSPVTYEMRYTISSDGSSQSWGIGSSQAMQLTSTGLTVNRGIVTRVNSQVTTTSPWAWNSNSFDQQQFTALANALTINADAGTPANGQQTIFRFTDNGTAQALTWTTGTSKSFRSLGTPLPTTTLASKTLYVGCIYNSTAERWDVIAVAQET